MDLRPRQLIGVAIVTSAATAFLVSLAVFGALSGEKPSRIAELIVERAPGPDAGSERVLRQDELVVSAVKRASPAVVSIVATKDVPVIERFFINPFPDDPFFRQFFGQEFNIPQFRQRGTEKQEVGAGTGFIVSADGLIVTNKHVVADTAADYTVFLSDGAKLPGRVLARDPVQDLAVVKVDRGNLATLPLGDSDKIQIGQGAIAIGNALGEFRNTISVGVVSGLGRTIVAAGPEGTGQVQELIQTDAAINPGNSGGPLLNLSGEVIGVNTAMARGAENIGFAIPINKAKRAIESVKASGRIIYPFLGIRYVMVTKEIAAEKKLAVDYGALIAGDGREPAIVKGSPADKAGLREGDVILEFNGERVEPPRTLAALIQKYRVGERIAMKVRRGNDTLALPATLEERK